MPKPDSINGRRPDLIAQKGKEQVILEVETKDTVDKDTKQREQFQDYADKHKNTKFRTKIV